MKDRYFLPLIFIVVFIFMIAASWAHCQEPLPDAPSAVHHWDKTWLIFGGAALLDLGSSAYDSHITMVGTTSGHGCYEANPALVGRYPSAGSLYTKNLGITGGIIVGSWAVKKYLHLPIAPYSGMAIDTFKHAHGVYRWYTFKDGACL